MEIEKHKHEKPGINPYRIWPQSLKWGVGAGLAMGIYLLILHITGAGDKITLKFLKYIFLFGFLGYGLKKYREANTTHTYFQMGIFLGALTTFISAISLILFDLLVNLVAPDFSFTKLNKEVEIPMDFLVINSAIFFEVLVYGMIITFIWLQFLKRNIDKNNANIKH